MSNDKPLIDNNFNTLVVINMQYLFSELDIEQFTEDEFINGANMEEDYTLYAASVMGEERFEMVRLEIYDNNGDLKFGGKIDDFGCLSIEKGSFHHTFATSCELTDDEEKDYQIRDLIENLLLFVSPYNAVAHAPTDVYMTKEDNISMDAADISEPDDIYLYARRSVYDVSKKAAANKTNLISVLADDNEIEDYEKLELGVILKTADLEDPEE